MTNVKQAKSASTVHTSEVLYSGRQFSFVKDHVTLPHKVEAEMAFIRHPGSAVIIPVFEDQRIGLIKQYRYVVNSYIYEVPAGTIDPNEQPEACAARELEEELACLGRRWVPGRHALSTAAAPPLNAQRDDPARNHTEPAPAPLGSRWCP